MPGSMIVFFILAIVAVATALGTIISRNAIYSALLLVLNFATIAVLYLILGAPFIALSQITVYAGSIMVLFLFVIMLLGAERLGAPEQLRWQPLAAIPLALILAGEFAYNLVRWTGEMVNVAATPADYGAPQAVGQLLFTQYTLPFEVTALILLSAVVGAIILAKPDQPSIGQAVRRVNASAAAPAGAASEQQKDVPAAEQEAVLKR